MTDRDDELDDFFRAARHEAPRPGAALMGRIAADAERLAPGGGWRRAWWAIGGWPALASFAAAALAGVWLGTAWHETLDAVIGASGYDLVDLMPGFGPEWEEAG